MSDTSTFSLKTHTLTPGLPRVRSKFDRCTTPQDAIARLREQVQSSSDQNLVLVLHQPGNTVVMITGSDTVLLRLAGARPIPGRPGSRFQPGRVGRGSAGYRTTWDRSVTGWHKAGPTALCRIVGGGEGHVCVRWSLTKVRSERQEIPTGLRTGARALHSNSCVRCCRSEDSRHPPIRPH
jgi:hypothetical protein